VPILFVVPAPGEVVDLDALQAHLERKIIEPPAKPKRIVVLPALPVTAVGKIFKPALRDLAIEEKARLEIERVFGAETGAGIAVSQDEKLNTRVHIVVDTGDGARLRQLAESLASLPQTYVVEGRT
jgi:fatty-acyl-CoA synthase